MNAVVPLRSFVVSLVLTIRSRLRFEWFETVRRENFNPNSTY
jgi:hypothetical protein